MNFKSVWVAFLNWHLKESSGWQMEVNVKDFRLPGHEESSERVILYFMISYGNVGC